MLRQELGETLFLHWEVDPAVVRPLVSSALSLDLYEGLAFVAMIFRRTTSVRPYGTDAAAFASYYEVHLRTYVQHNGAAGLWYFSMDSGNDVVGRVGRAWMKLPFFHAKSEGCCASKARRGWARSERLAEQGRGAMADVSYELGASVGAFVDATLEGFLHNRVRVYSEHEGALYLTRLRHEPYTFCEVKVRSLEETLSLAAHLSLPSSKPLLAFCAERAVLDLWPVALVR